MVLREIDAGRDDLGIYLRWLRDTQNNSFIQSARTDFGLAELVHFVDAINSDDNALLFGIFLNGISAEFIGTLKVQPIDFLKRIAWVGIMIGNPEFRGRGYGREAMQEVLNYLFNALKLDEVFLGVDLKNLDAVSLYKTLGFNEHLREEHSMIMVKKSPNFEKRN
jgi:RimJ/RimL family protein N-acetyltransferase